MLTYGIRHPQMPYVVATFASGAKRANIMPSGYSSNGQSPVKVRLTGSGDVTVQVSDELDVRIADSGAVRYLGKPTVEKTITGSGDAERIGD